ncbi:hypothetical protein MHBO_003446, partial [Bonamia ostreae]
MRLENFEMAKNKESTLISINPLAAFRLAVCTEENFVLPEISLSSRDCLRVYDAMTKTLKELKKEENNDKTITEIKALDPEKYFKSPCITKNQVTTYGKELKKLISTWHRQGNWNLVDKVLISLSKNLLDKIKKMESQEQKHDSENPTKQTKSPKKKQKKDLLKNLKLSPLPKTTLKRYDGPYSDDFLLRQIVPLLVEMRNNSDLPAIVFGGSQKICDAMLLETLKYLETNESFVISKNDLKERKRAQKDKLKKMKAWKRERDRIEKKKEEEMLRDGTIPDEINADEDEE